MRMEFSGTRASCLLVCLRLSIIAVCECAGYPPAPNCARYECPPYAVVLANSELEIRTYDTALWASSPNVSAQSYSQASNKGFRILFDYYGGNNVQHEKINMTAPVLVDVENLAYTVNFYLPKKYQSKSPSPPSPSSDQIKVEKLPKYKYAAVRRYDGFVSENNIREQLASLKKGLKGTIYQRASLLNRYTVASYNSPMELFKRVNEIFLWFD